MCFTFKKNNKQTKKPVNCFLQDDASAGIQSLQTSIVTKLCQNPGDRLCINAGENGDSPSFSLVIVEWFAFLNKRHQRA